MACEKLPFCRHLEMAKGGGFVCMPCINITPALILQMYILLILIKLRPKVVPPATVVPAGGKRTA